jgi:hypothetical protein
MGIKWESGLDQLQGTSSKDTRPSTFESHFITLQSSLPKSAAVENIVLGIKQQIRRLNTSAPQTNGFQTHTMLR